MVFDSFEMAENIAACASDANQVRGTCGVDIGGLIVFMDASSGCDFLADYDGDFGFCYYVPTADSTVFGS